VIRFIPSLDTRSVRYYFAALLQLLAVVLAPPLLASVLARDFFYTAIFTGLILLVWSLGFLGRRGPTPALALREALVVTALAYLTFALVGTVPFLPLASFWDGFFESMSGFTTTGLSVLELTTLPSSLLFFRAYSQWIGGAGIIILSLAVLIGPGRAAFRLYASEFGEEHLVGNVVATARVVVTVYGILTLLAFAAFVAAGMSAFDGLLHALATISTGGFSPRAEGIAAYDSELVAGAVTLFMLLGAVSFPLYYFAWRSGWRRFVGDIQVRYLVVMVAAGALLLFALANWDLAALPSTLFHLASAISTTGFSVSDPAAWPAATTLLVIGLMVIGGSAGSTAGGIKLLRLAVLGRVASWSVLRTLLPEEATLPVKVDGETVNDLEIRQTVSLFGIYVATAFASALLLVMAGFSIQEGLFESVSALSTVGLSVGVTSAELPVWAKLTLCLTMWAGRLEILPILVLLHPGNWR
jgi:trk system potassium uptake protein TrkH